MKKMSQVRQVVFPVLSALIWGTAFVAQDVVADKMDAFTFNALRSAVAVAVLLVIIRIFDHFSKDKPQRTETEKKYDRRQLLWGGLWCGLALCVASNFQQAGIGAGTDAGKAGFITALYVVLVPVFGLFFKRKVSLPVWIAVGLSVLALYLLCIKGDFTLAPGDLLILCCAVVFAAHILIIDHFTATVDGVKLCCAQFFVCGVLSAIGMVFFSHPDWGAIWESALPILYVGIFSSGVAYSLQILAQKDANPTVITILLSLESVFAVIAGALILHQRMTAREYLGCVIMFIAVILAQLEFPIKKKNAENV
ncbi:MAG: DMT family transporter [Oscillospiraceae bacterium]|nr:DMT family transporter [Oscillospiraceae bacterium]